MRTRSRWIWGASIPVWVVSLIFFDQVAFSWQQALILRGAESAIAAVSLAWLARRRALPMLELATIAGWILIASMSAYAFTIMPADKLPAKVAALELSCLVVCLIGAFPARTTFAIALVAVLSLTVLPFIGAKSLWLLALTVVGFAYVVLIASAAARDRLARSELEARRQLSAANEKLREEDELRRRLFVNLSHDFRTPLAVIRGEAAMLRETGRVADEDAALARVERNAVALADLADQLLDLARLEAGQMPVKKRPFDIGALVRDVAAQIAPSRIDTVGDEGTVLADSAHVSRIVGNLVANALRQSKEKVTIRTRLAHGAIEIDVIDEGAGVPAERREAIFMRFVSFDSDGSTASGIGLPLARELAVLNDGSLSLVEGASKTTFRLTLPASDRAPEEVVVADGGRPAAIPPGRLEGKRRRRVLVVEDNLDMGALLVRALGASFRVEHVSTVADGLTALHEDPPACVLSDVMLPDGTGYDVLAKAKEEHPGLPVIFVSALGHADERVRGLAAGVDDYLPKPFAPNELVSRVSTAIERAEGWREKLDAQRDGLLMEVHDGVSASLARASILLGDPTADPSHVRDAIKDGLDEVRAITRLLAPRAATFGELASEIRRSMADACAANRLELVFESEGEAGAPVPAPLAHTLRRVARESTTNAIKHANAKTIRCVLAIGSEALTMTIEDDGQGLPAEHANGHGLGIMARRVARVGGEASIANRAENAENKGVQVSVKVPRMNVRS